MNKMSMNNRKKALFIAGTVLTLTLGVFALKNYILFTNKGFAYGNPVDLALILPALPFAPLLILFKEPGMLAATTIILIATIFWLAVAYFIGAHLDKKKK